MRGDVSCESPWVGPADLLAPPVRKKVTVEQRKYHLSGGGCGAGMGGDTVHFKRSQCACAAVVVSCSCALSS